MKKLGCCVYCIHCNLLDGKCIKYQKEVIINDEKWKEEFGNCFVEDIDYIIEEPKINKKLKKTAGY